MSKLAMPTDDHTRRYVRLAGLPHSHSVNDVINAGPSTSDSRVRHGRRSSTPLELEACCRNNIVTARTRFFEEKSRSSSPATPPRRRSRSVTPQSTRQNDDRHPPSNPGSTPSTQHVVRHLAIERSTQPVATTPLQTYQSRRRGQLMPALTAVSESTLPTNKTRVNNEADELKVSTHLQLFVFL